MMMVLILILFPGKDVLAKAKTGTGKTVAFLVRCFICLFIYFLKKESHNYSLISKPVEDCLRDPHP